MKKKHRGCGGHKNDTGNRGHMPQAVKIAKQNEIRKVYAAKRRKK